MATELRKAPTAAASAGKPSPGSQTFAGPRCGRAGGRARLQADGALHQVDGGLQDLAALRRDQLRQRLREKARGAEAEAAVHGIGGQLERLLPDVQLRAPQRAALGLQQRLGLAPLLHQAADDLRTGRQQRSEPSRARQDPWNRGRRKPAAGCPTASATTRAQSACA